LAPSKCPSKWLIKLFPTLEMAHKVMLPQEKIMSRSFLNSGTLIVIFVPRRNAEYFRIDKYT
jgi:hypothetical protein